MEKAIGFTLIELKKLGFHIPENNFLANQSL